MKGKRQCIVAPNKHHYVYCPSCGKGDPKEPWRFLYCSENCRDIYKTCSDFVDGIITGEEANNRLKSLDLSDIADFHPLIQNNIADIYASVAQDKPASKPAPAPAPAKEKEKDKAEDEDTKKNKKSIL